MKYVSSMVVIVLLFLQNNLLSASEINHYEISLFFQKVDSIFQTKDFQAAKKLFSSKFNYYSYNYEGINKIEEHYVYDQYLNELKMYFNSDANIKEYKTYIEGVRRSGAQAQIEVQINSVVEYEDFTSYCNVSALYALTKENDKIVFINFAGVAECNPSK